MPEWTARSAWGPVSSLMNSARYSINYFGTLVEALRTVIEDDLWRDFIGPLNRAHHYDRFTDFLTYIEASPDELLAVLRTRGEDDLAGQVLGLVTEPMGLPKMKTGSCSNTTSDGTNPDAVYVVSRLKRDDPDLAEQVVEGRISPHAAAVKAGIRKPRATYRTDDPVLAVKAILRHFTKQQILNALETP